jgi:DNA mismatch endonuclease (patch repair protein)
VTDIVSSEKRSEMMACIRGKNTSPEIRVRRLLHWYGYRYRLHRKDLPGAPDIVLPRWRAVIFIHGCFWHQHDGCKFAKMPATRRDFWEAKLSKNRKRDQAAVSSLRASGWRVLVVWECYLRVTKDDSDLVNALSSWIEGLRELGELSAQTSGILTNR